MLIFKFEVLLTYLILHYFSILAHCIPLKGKMHFWKVGQFLNMPYAEKKSYYFANATRRMARLYHVYRNFDSKSWIIVGIVIKLVKKRPFSNFLYRNSIVGEKILDELVYFTNIKQHSIASTKSQLSWLNFCFVLCSKR